MVSKARLASALLGVGAGGGELERLTVSSERGGAPVEALFNPNEISVSRSLQWQEPRRTLQASGDHEGRALFRYVEAETLSIELFFDTYESRSDVRDHTGLIVDLAEVDQYLHRPPICHLQWGNFDIFTGVLSRIAQRFTLFLEDGRPVRATLSCNFLESAPRSRGRARELHSADVTKTRQVRRGDSVHSIAAEEYSDPALWRHIATANGILNPRDLQPGTVLIIPRLRT